MKYVIGSVGLSISTDAVQLNNAISPNIHIMNVITNNIIYDNNLGDPEDGDPTTIIGGGQIKIHRR